MQEIIINGWNDDLTLKEIKLYGKGDDDNNWYGNPVLPIMDIFNEVGIELGGEEDDGIVWEPNLGNGANDPDILLGTGKCLNYQKECEFMEPLVRRVDFIKLENDEDYKAKIKAEIKKFVIDNIEEF